jgi:hypothetical protein
MQFTNSVQLILVTLFLLVVGIHSLIISILIVTRRKRYHDLFNLVINSIAKVLYKGPEKESEKPFGKTEKWTMSFFYFVGGVFITVLGLFILFKFVI